MSYVNRNLAIRLKCYDCNFSSVLFCYNGLFLQRSLKKVLIS